MAKGSNRGQRRRRAGPPSVGVLPDSAGTLWAFGHRTLQQEDIGKPFEMPGMSVDGHRCPEVALQGPEASAMVDLLSIQGDLRLVVAACEHSVEIARQAESVTEHSEHDRLRTLQRALYEGAVIAYGRAFTKGRSLGGEGRPRERIPDDLITSLPPALQATHDRALQWRNKQVAHRVDDFVQGHAVAALRPVESGQTPGVVTVMTRMLAVVPGAENMTQLRELGLTLIQRLEKHMWILRDRTEKELKALPVAELYSAAGIDLNTPAPDASA